MVCAVMLMLTTGVLCAQDLPRIQHFDKSVYGAQNQNWAISQTEDGLMVFANNAGLLTFDGFRWQLAGLPHGQVARSVFAQGNRLYTGGFSEFAVFEPDKKTGFKYRPANLTSDNQVVLSDEIWHIVPSAFDDSSVYYQSFSRIYKYRAGRSVELKPPSNIMFLQNVNGRMLFQGIGRGLYELKSDGSFYFLEGTELLSQTIVAFIAPLQGDSVLVGTKNHGFFVVAGISCTPWSSVYNNMLRPLQPNKAVVLHNGGLAIGTVLDGVFVFDNRMQLQYHINQTNGLQNNTVLSMFVDKAGGLWLGLDKGIDRINLNARFRWYHDLEGRIGNVYAAVLHQGVLYVGTNHGVYWRPWHDSGKPFEFIKGTQGQVWHMQVFNDHVLCGHNEGTFLIQNGRSVLISDITGGWQTIAVPGRPDMLLQGTYSGLVVFARAAGGGWQVRNRVSGFSEPIRQIQFDKQGQLWAVHPNCGLWRLTLDRDLQAVQSLKRITAADGIGYDDKVRLLNWHDTLLVKSGSHVWAYTAQGFKTYTLPLPLDGQLLILPQGHMALARPKELIVQTQGRLVSWPVDMVENYEKIEVLGGDQLLFCLENGFATCRLSDLVEAQTAPHKVRVSVLEVVSDPVERFFMPADAGPVQLRATQNNLRFYISPPDFEGSHYIKWQLDGSTHRSGVVDQSGLFELNSLPAGNYTLRLLCHDQTTTFDFEIRRHWWLRWWALIVWLLMFTGLFGLVEFYNRLRISRSMDVAHAEYLRALELQKIKAEKDRLEKEQILENQLRHTENQRLQDELDNKNRELSNLTLNLIRKNELLADLKTKLKDISSENDKVWQIIRAIDTQMADDNEWALFENAFNQVHDAFFKKIKHAYPELSTGDLRLAALLKLNLNSKEIAAVLGISVRGIENKRYRLRKKLGLAEDVNLTEWLIVF